MSSIDARANLGGVEASVSRAMTPPRRLGRKIVSILGGFVLTGVFLALSAAVFPLVAVYSFVWLAQH